MREIASVVRDTANDIHETATELKESGVTGETARSIEVTIKAAQDTIQTVREYGQTDWCSSQATKAAQAGAESVEEESKHETEKMIPVVESKANGKTK